MRRLRLGHLPFVVLALGASIGLPARAQVQPGTLPTGWSITGGKAAFVQSGATLNINQTTSQALVNFQSFNVGSGAAVNILQPSSQSALLARTLGGGASQIDGRIKATGSLWLINPAGIMVSAGSRIDVGSFVASTLNISDSDFLAGRLTFERGATAGEVRNAGVINAASRGSIYLVAPSVVNIGTLNAPNGEVLLAAGQNVQLMDTGTPGVYVVISGKPGEVKNLGHIVAEAGRIGLAAGLVSNSGQINADSVVSDGGRVFLRASGDLKTSATSQIDASGTTGGRVELIAAGAASIDGRVAAMGSAGKGGYVDTSGHASLDVVNVPRVGRGGEWHIDPYDIEIVASGPNAGTTGTDAIVSNESGARVGADTVVAQLDAGVNVSITTGTGNPATDPWHGDITVSAPIGKTGNVASGLTLNASNNVVINAPITSANSPLTLNVNSNYQDNYPGVDHSVQLNASMDLRGGVLNVSEGLGGSGNGTLRIGAGTTSLNMPASAINAATVSVLPGATLALNRAGSALAGSLSNDGTVSVGGTGTAVLDHGGSHSGQFDVASGAGLAMSGGQTFNGGAAFTGTGTVEWSGDVFLNTTLLFGTGGNPLVLHDTNLWAFETGRLSTQGAGVVVDGQVAMRGAGAWTNGTSVAVIGNGAISSADEGTRFQNDGIITTSGTQTDVLRGAGGALANFVNNGSLVKTSAVDQQYTGFASTAGSVVRSDVGLLSVSGAQLDGQIQVAAGAHVTLDSVALNSDVSFVGAGTMAWQNYITLMGSVDVGAGAPELSLGASTAINGQGNVLTTRNVVHADGAQAYVLDQSVWNNLGTFSVGPGGESALILQGSGTFNNQPGGTVQVNQGVLDATFDAAHVNGGAIVLQAGGTLRTGGADIYNSGRISGSGTLAMGGASGGTLFNNGTVAPGTSATVGQLLVQGNYAQGSSGVLGIKVAGLGAGAFDALDVAGSAQLGGMLQIHALGSFASTNGAQADFVVAHGAGNGGTFDQVVTAPSSSVNGVVTLSVSYPAQGTARVTATIVPSLVACVSNPAIAGCTSVLPTLPACIATPATAGCSAVLPTLATCTAAPSTAGCGVVLPSLAACEATPSAAGCAVILPSLAACAATPTLSGCAAVLPPLALCMVSPTLPGCAVVALPTSATPTQTVLQALNQTVNITNTASAPQPTPLIAQDSASRSGADSTNAGPGKDKTGKDDKPIVSDKSDSKNEPTKKMYCN
jgi:filamentous hemagglutinin family protein